jgi:hypothetical protein
MVVGTKSRRNVIIRAWLFEFVFSLLLASGIIIGYNRWHNWSVENQPASDWFEVNRLSVPDFPIGVDPIILYSRDIKRHFEGEWIVEIRPVIKNANYSVCTGSGLNEYESDKTVPPDGVTLSWFMGRGCFLQPGQYALYCFWHIRVPGYQEKVYSYISNVFTVKPRERQS